jgi:predicted CXXCH cytochrome family protein
VNRTAGLPEQKNILEDYMKIVKLGLVLVAAAMMMFGLSTITYAFHSGGVAECVGCHSMHTPMGGALLTGTDPSSTCLNCHAAAGQSSYHIATANADLTAGVPPYNMTPGGDFAWLKKSYYWTVRGSADSEEGRKHGHNIVAADFGYVVDADNPTAPGGTYNSTNLGCTSCHDQHGQVRRNNTGAFSRSGGPIIASGSYGTSVVPAAGQTVGGYRLLRSNLSDNTIGAAVGSNFANSPVVAFAPSTYNKSEFYTQTRVSYNSQMSDYCGSCHPDMHSSAGILRHPVGQNLGGGIIGNYNTYVKSGDLSGASASSYLSLVPFEENLAVNPANLATLQASATNAATSAGPGATAQVMCVSCHRAHASGFVEMARWNNEGEFMVIEGAYPGTDATVTAARAAQFARGKTVVETAASYYNKPVTAFATYQRVLCNKCHAKD